MIFRIQYEIIAFDRSILVLQKRRAHGLVERPAAFVRYELCFASIIVQKVYYDSRVEPPLWAKREL